MQHPPIPTSLTPHGFPVVAWVPLTDAAARVGGEAVAILRRPPGQWNTPYVVVHAAPGRGEWATIGRGEAAETLGEATAALITAITDAAAATLGNTRPRVPDDALPDANERALQRGLGRR